MRMVQMHFRVTLTQNDNIGLPEGFLQLVKLSLHCWGMWINGKRKCLERVEATSAQ
jgi:hypothetical protein